MSHCHTEHDGHDHHGHDHGAHDHSSDITPALQNLLYDQIDFDAVTTLNEEEAHSGKAVLRKTYIQRLDDEPELKSDCDEQLIVHVPFTGQVRLHSILMRTSQDAHAPKTLRVFINHDTLEFSDAETHQPTQEFALAQTSDVQEIPVKRALFNTTRSLDLFFPDNFGDGDEEVTRISYLAFKGDFMRLNKEPVSVLYEAAANPSDHKTTVGANLGAHHHIS